MPKTAANNSRRTNRSAGAARSTGWKFEDAKARFSEVVKFALNEGPQHVTTRGGGVVVVISAEEFDRLMPRKPLLAFVDFMESLHLNGLDLTR